MLNSATAILHSHKGTRKNSGQTSGMKVLLPPHLSVFIFGIERTSELQLSFQEK
jgi:hypothetical protein